MIHIYSGNGKGKTTSSFGLAMRASGQGLKVIIFQFLKPRKLVCGEEISAKKIKNIKIVKYDEQHPMFNGAGKTKKSMKIDIAEARKAIFGGRYDMVILDEIINVIDQGFSGKKEFLNLVKNIPEDIELVLTGRGDISELEKLADYVTIMVDKKHPFRQQVNARRGIEY
ncbi:MAG: cob(I)yrinic acid a,c-diamide adenosyltransferase [Candidatus Omnitrophica bacterium CG22_combo_CG10-13_8_21_14_all_43_16]|nr:MAG: cob(I)yrinic acid a,c-diamide adenosyltransferase [Candidatus Omnitrophica bacterium CG22_combo_CG10-13_8_21_14_all_43_16]